MREWLEPDGQGGFASGTADLIRTRRYHAMLLASTPAGRFVLVNGLEAWVEAAGETVPLSSQYYDPGVTHPDGAQRVLRFTHAPWPHWVFAVPGGELLFETFVAPGTAQTCLRWRWTCAGQATLRVRPFLSGRGYHALHAENPAFQFQPELREGAVLWRPYPDLPPIAAHGGTYTHAPEWYRRFLYTEEAARGLDCVEDLASPGVLTWHLGDGNSDATLALRADDAPCQDVATLADAERTRRSGIGAPARAAEQFVIAQRGGQTIIAGYPWFTDWGRDTFIALRGLLLATGRHAEAARVLAAWADVVSQGMLPNFFPDGDRPAEYNSVDASLWFIVAVHDLLAAGDRPEAAHLRTACTAILEGYTAGTRFGIRADSDGLLACGQPGVQLTWMDAKVGDWVVTPRIGKPVEVQALWINALTIAGAWPGGERWRAMAPTARDAFLAAFPDGSGGLADVIGPDGAQDTRLRPNQVFACGGLPFTCVPDPLAATILARVEAHLLTPLGLRTLDPADPDYRGTYQGGVRQRDGAYHQGTVWPWLMGAFVDGWLRLRGPDAKAEAREKFLAPLRAHLNDAGLGSVSEIADGNAPHAPRGCPFQAWSVGELLRIETMLKEVP